MVFPIRRASACVPKVLESSLGRVPQAPRRLHTYAWTQRWFVQFFGSGLICPPTQTCCALKSSAPSVARQDNCADLLGLQTRRVQIIQQPKLANQILARTFFRSVALQLACTAVGKFSRASSAGGRLRLQTKFRKSDRVGRRGLSEPREDFSRLHTCAIPWLNSVAKFRG